MNSVWQFSTAACLKFGRGASSQLGEVAAGLIVKHALIVTDSVVAALPPVQHAIGSLTAHGVAATVFDGGIAEPPIETALAAIEAGRACQADAVIGIGGGSNLDVAKMAAVVLRHGGTPSDYFGFDRIPGPTLPVIALPTTAGTGSEVSHSSVLTDSRAEVKVSTLSRWLRPACAIVDPQLTDSCPAGITGQSGIDALVHAIEAYTNRDYSDMLGVDPQARAYEGAYPLTELLACEAIRLVGQHLVTAVGEPHNHTARDGMAQAAMLAGMAFSNSGVGIVHALEYPIGALTHCGHGEGNGLLLPHVMRFNLPFRHQKFSHIAQLLDCDLQGLSQAEAAQAAIDEIVRLQSKIGIRTRLRDLGMAPSAIAGVAAKAIEIRRLMELNIRTPTQRDLVEILDAAY